MTVDVIFVKTKITAKKTPTNTSNEKTIRKVQLNIFPIIIW